MPAIAVFFPGIRAGLVENPVGRVRQRDITIFGSHGFWKIRQKRCLFSNGSPVLVQVSRRKMVRFARHISAPKVWADRVIRWCVNGFSVSIIITAKAKSHHPISHCLFRLFVVWPRCFYLATKSANSRPLPRSNFLGQFRGRRHVAIC